jgi:hypothetical protein
MARTYLLSLKVVNLAIFAWLALIFYFQIFNFEAVVTTADNEFVIFAFIRAIRNVVSLLIYGCGLAIIFGISFITAGVYNQYLFNFIEIFFKKYLSSWFSISSPNLQDIPNLMLNELDESIIVIFLHFKFCLSFL